MNHYRCDNGCTYFEQHYCNFLHDRLANIEIVHIERVGCASHSDYQSERDKVLSLIRCFIEHEGFNCGETDAIKEYMEELRQAGEP
jgi:predicted nucleic-acid-binding protein